MKLCILATLTLASTVFAQGPLTPPGAPAPTMKTLDEIHAKVADAGEKRTPISYIPFTISQPGSYYLTTNLSTVLAVDGISIDAKNVTIDLNGFRMTGFGAGLAAIKVTNTTVNTETLVVKNGVIDGWQTAVSGNSTAILGGTIEGLQIKGGWGIVLNQARNFTVKECSLDGCAASSSTGVIQIGDQCSIIGCRVSNASGPAISYGIVVGDNSQISNCSVGGAVDVAINGAINVSVRGCTVNGSGLKGFEIGFGADVEGCLVRGVYLYGIYANQRASVRNCALTGSANTIAGVNLAIGGGKVENVSVQHFPQGIIASNATIRSCDIRSASMVGISVSINSRVTNCSVAESPLGIECVNSNTIESTDFFNCNTGINLTGNSNRVFKNTFLLVPIPIVNNGVNYTTPVSTLSTATNPNANISN